MTRNPAAWSVRLQAALSVLLVFAVPLAMALVPAVGGLVGFDPSVSGADPVAELLKGLVIASAFFAWFIVGAVLGLRAVRTERQFGWRMLALVGLAGNALVIVLGGLFVLGEVLSPH